VSEEIKQPAEETPEETEVPAELDEEGDLDGASSTITVEELAAKAKTDSSTFAVAKALKGWAIGIKITEAEYSASIKAALSQRIGY
jgi:hypothetical protein